MVALGLPACLWLILRRKVRLIVAQNPLVGCVAIAAKWLGKQMGKRVAVIVESHGDFETTMLLNRRVLFPEIQRFVVRRMAQMALRHSEVLRAVSHETRRQLEELAPGKTIFEFMAWTDIEAFLSVRAQEPPGRREVIYAGNLAPLKGVHLLIEAFSLVRPNFANLRLRLVGDSVNPAYAEKLRRMTTAAGLEKWVVFEDAVSQRELAKRFSLAAVLVLPSLSEALGRVVLEAMAVGIPVIGSSVGGIPELIADGETGFLVKPGDVPALAERLAWVLDHPDQGRDMGLRGRAFAIERFSATGYRDAYHQMLDAAAKLSSGPVQVS
jgi:glycosyltransferase involved in cell wall biosynthesis